METPAKGRLMKDGHYFDKNGNEVWVQNGKYHRLDGPAVVGHPYGFQYWYKNGLHHRLDGPAFILSDGSKSWYKDGMKHREDGPAVIWGNGNKQYYFESIKYPNIQNDFQWKLEVQKMKRQRNKPTLLKNNGSILLNIIKLFNKLLFK